MQSLVHWPTNEVVLRETRSVQKHLSVANKTIFKSACRRLILKGIQTPLKREGERSSFRKIVCFTPNSFRQVYGVVTVEKVQVFPTDII